ncbi:excisionase family DNA-binding protein [Botrimarina mediterranea]|uniref:excisionase family DNA-binding protein n=1 Tax=Botrimarina mediterranea TaxID=2528022 RepID=UPI00118894EA|nr:Helix-turn-helix domain protein [Planctomycetes bacterium K2D]
MIEDRYLRRTQAARYSNRSLATIDRAIAAGDLPAIRDGRSVLIDRLDLDDYLQSLKTTRRPTLVATA